MPDVAIRGFWKWWQSARELVEGAVRAGTWDELAPQINARVKEIDPGLEWELGKGAHAEHAFCLSAKGDSLLRNVAERWLREGPSSDDTWEFHAARQAHWSEGLTLGIEGHDVTFDALRFELEIDQSRERVHVGVYHPTMEPMAPELRTTVAFLSLDSLLGEDGVERWVGSVETLVKEPGAGVSGPALRAAVDALARGATGERFAVLEGTDPDGHPVLVTANLALKRIDHLLLDVHLAVVIALREPTSAGLTTSAEAAELDALEDALLDALGPRAVYVGRETRRSERVVHLYVDGSAGVRGSIEGWRAQPKGHEIRVILTPDPTWALTAEIRGS